MRNVEEKEQEEEEKAGGWQGLSRTEGSQRREGNLGWDPLFLIYFYYYYGDGPMMMMMSCSCHRDEGEQKGPFDLSV